MFPKFCSSFLCAWVSRVLCEYPLSVGEKKDLRLFNLLGGGDCKLLTTFVADFYIIHIKDL